MELSHLAEGVNLAVGEDVGDYFGYSEGHEEGAAAGCFAAVSGGLDE